MEIISEVLEQAGYFEERRVDITDILHMYDEYGYHYNINQKMFMENFAYLDIHYNHPLWKQDMSVQLNPIEAQREIIMDVVEMYNAFLDDDLLIIGSVEQENITLFFSQKGFYYGGYDDCLINWGDNFIMMLNMLIHGEKGKLQIIESFP